MTRQTYITVFYLILQIFSLVTDKHKRKIRVCLSDMKNLFKLLIKE